MSEPIRQESLTMGAEAVDEAGEPPPELERPRACVDESAGQPVGPPVAQRYSMASECVRCRTGDDKDREVLIDQDHARRPKV